LIINNCIFPFGITFDILMIMMMMMMTTTTDVDRNGVRRWLMK